MLLVGLFWVWIAVVSVGIGLGVARLLRALGGPLPPLVAESPELLSLTGLAGSAWLVAVLSFAWPVALPMQLGVSALAAALLLWQRTSVVHLLQACGRQWRGAGAGGSGLAAVLALLVLVHATQLPVFTDAMLYHAQFVQWLHRFAVVPGLGNLHGRLAFNSHTHLLTAFFSPARSLGRGPAFQQTFNSFGFLLLTLHHVRRAAAHLQPTGRPWLVGYYLGSLVLLLMATRSWISSPMTDTPVAVLGLLLLGVLLETPRLTAAGLAWLVVLATTGITYKAAAAPLLLWAMAWALRSPTRHWGRRLALLVGVGLVVGLPWLGRNIVLSGYLVYPLVTSPGPVVAAWAVPTPRVAADLVEIRLFAKRPVTDWPRAAGQPLRQWLPFWWRQHEPADQRLLLLLAGSVLVASSLGWRLQARWWKRMDYQLYGLLLLSCVWWFTTAPALRFGYAYLIGAAVLGPLLVVQALPVRWLRAGGWLLGALSLVYGLNGLRNEINRPGDLISHGVWPADYRAVQPRVAARLGAQQLAVTAGSCGNSALPCTDTLYTGLELRGATLQQGFRMRVPGAKTRD
ncbi:MAG: LIC_10190 family membrane protein [Janthinobacterium lividum]